MSDLDPAHVEAVAEEVNGLTIGSGYYQAQVGMEEAREAAEDILTSTDPDVHAALLAALVRAGVLSEERTEPYIQNRSTGPCEMHSGFGRTPSRTPGRRYVTRWEDVT